MSSITLLSSSISFTCSSNFATYLPRFHLSHHFNPGPSLYLLPFFHLFFQLFIVFSALANSSSNFSNSSFSFAAFSSCSPTSFRAAGTRSCSATSSSKSYFPSPIVLTPPRLPPFLLPALPALSAFDFHPPARVSFHSFNFSSASAHRCDIRELDQLLFPKFSEINQRWHVSSRGVYSVSAYLWTKNLRLNFHHQLCNRLKNRRF